MKKLDKNKKKEFSNMAKNCLEKIVKAAVSVKNDKTNLADNPYLVHSDDKKWGRSTRSFPRLKSSSRANLKKD